MRTRIGNIRELICRQDCPTKCARHLRNEIDHEEPSEKCEISWKGQWHSTMPGVAPAPAVIPLQKIAKEEQGRAAWAWLHAEAEKGALTEDRITNEFEPMIPNYGCQCKAKWKAIRKPLTADQKRWAIDRHNDVNRELGKPIWEANTPP